MDYAFKVEIALDDEKILADQVYDLDDMYKIIREMFTQKDMHDVSEGNGQLTFISKKGEKDVFSTCGLNVTELYQSEWAVPYLKKMLWYNGSNGVVDDVLYECRNYEREYGKLRKAQ